MHTLARPCALAGQEMSLSCSVGLAVYPEDGTDFDTLIRNADAAMYNAKEAGRNTFRFYSQQMNEDAVHRLDIQNRLRRALERNEFILHYQPLIDLATTHRRRRSPDPLELPRAGHAAPGVFIPVAEDSGLIVEIGEWVLREACRQARAWQDAGHRDLVLAVNLSPPVRPRQPGGDRAPGPGRQRRQPRPDRTRNHRERAGQGHRAGPRHGAPAPCHGPAPGH
jgi:predicted signal transduction protein with EAL and GGDEF domain